MQEPRAELLAKAEELVALPGGEQPGHHGRDVPGAQGTQGHG